MEKLKTIVVCSARSAGIVNGRENEWEGSKTK